MNKMPVDILVFAPHPDDAELCCGGLLLKAKARKKTVAVVDLTRGEMGTRGSISIRKREAAAASRLLQLHARENLGLRDGGLQDDEQLRVALVRSLRRYRPALLLAPHWEDQHPDHAAVGQAAIHAAFMAGVPKFDPRSAHDIARPDRLPYRPHRILHYNNRYGIDADVVVDISDVFEQKLDLVRCYDTQFGAGNAQRNNSPQTRLSHSQFMDWLRGMHAFYGFKAGVAYGEPYCVKNPLLVSDIAMLD